VARKKSTVEKRQLKLLESGFDMGGLTVEAKKLREKIYAVR
jgi:hypothetical protein